MLRERSRRLGWALAMLLMCCAARASDALPSDRQIPATVVRRIQPKADALRMPTAATIDGHGRLYIADGAQDRVVRLREDGAIELAIASADGLNLSRPVGVCADSGESLWIADTGNHRIVCVSPAGTSPRQFVVPRLGGAKDPEPTDLALQHDGRRLYVVDKANHRLMALTPATGQWSVMGAAGAARGQLQWPFMVCTAPDGYVYVSDVIGARVQRISESNRWAGEVGAFGVEVGQFYRPKGVAADADGRLYVSDSTLGVVQVFNADGTIRGVLCGKDGRPLRFEHPMGLCFDAQARLYVVELMADRVAVVSLAPAKVGNAAVAKSR